MLLLRCLALPAVSVATPRLREDLLAPRFYTTEVAKAARTDLDRQREAFASLPQEMEQDDNRDHFDRRACLSRLAEWSAP
jgi:magnesium-protoporphyrin IX monomethyl ester (oxidative) cyclase